MPDMVCPTSLAAAAAAVWRGPRSVKSVKSVILHLYKFREKLKPPTEEVPRRACVGGVIYGGGESRTSRTSRTGYLRAWASRPAAASRSRGDNSTLP